MSTVVEHLPRYLLVRLRLQAPEKTHDSPGKVGKHATQCNQLLMYNSRFAYCYALRPWMATDDVDDAKYGTKEPQPHVTRDDRIHETRNAIAISVGGASNHESNPRQLVLHGLMQRGVWASCDRMRLALHAIRGTFHGASRLGFLRAFCSEHPALTCRSKYLVRRLLSCLISWTGDKDALSHELRAGASYSSAPRFSLSSLAILTRVPFLPFLQFFQVVVPTDSEDAAGVPR